MTEEQVTRFLKDLVIDVMLFGYQVGAWFDSRVRSVKPNDHRRSPEERSTVGCWNEWASGLWVHSDKYIDKESFPVLTFRTRVDHNPHNASPNIQDINVPVGWRDFSSMIDDALETLVKKQNHLGPCEAEGCDSFIVEKDPVLYGKYCKMHVSEQMKLLEIQETAQRVAVEKKKDWRRAHLLDGDRVYFVQSGDFVKIGFSKAIESRLTSLQTGNPVALKLLTTVTGPASLERMFHDLFAAHRTSGEWFKAKPVIEYLKKEHYMEDQPID